MNKKAFRKTKIIATIGPAVDNAESISKLVKAGMDVARLNFSHGGHSFHRKIFNTIREVAEEEGKPVAILQDIQGPKIRVGSLSQSVTLKEGEEVKIVCGTEGGPGEIPINYPKLIDDIKEGEVIYISDGRIKIEVTRKHKDYLKGKVVAGGLLSSYAGASFPYSSITISSITEKDIKDLELGLQLGVDYIAVSFVKGRKDLEEVKKIVGDDIPLIAKIELAIAYSNLEEIIKESHGVMVARGDLGVEMPLEKIPVIQRDILQKTNQIGKVSITATEMLESMRTNFRPTRAEVTDVATAIFEHSDALMLSAETATGRYPIRSVEVMDAICKTTEPHVMPLINNTTALQERSFLAATANAAVAATQLLGMDVIVVFTESGTTARLLSKLKPQAKIIAFTLSEKICRRMSLYWGVYPFIAPRFSSLDDLLSFTEWELKRLKICKEGDQIFIIGGIASSLRFSENFMKIHKVG